MSDKRAAALEYAARGWAVFPCRPDGKAPDGTLAPHGVKDATADPARVAAWWAAAPSDNVAIAAGASGLVVIDCDRHAEGADGVAIFAAWAEANDVALGNVPRVSTRSDGRHYYWRAPAGSALKPGAGLLLGVDVRAGDSYVIAPPSTGAGGAWAWELAPADGELTEAPAVLLELIAAARRAAPVLESDADAGGRIKDGRRRASAAVAGALRKYGAGPAAIEAALDAVNQTAFAAPLDRGEIRKAARGIAERYAPDGARDPETGAAALSPKADITAWIDAVKNDPPGYKTGFANVDAEGVRLMPGSVAYIIGHSGHCKTTFLVNLALNLARDYKTTPVLFISLEVRDVDLKLKMGTVLQGPDGLTFAQFRSAIRGEYDNEAARDWTATACDRMTALYAGRFHTETPAEATAADVAGYVAAVRDLYDAPPVALVDYAQIIRPGRRREDARYLELAEISDVLVKAAKENDAVIIAGAQSRRPAGAQGSAEKPPTINDLRESADLVFDAALVLGLYAPAKDLDYKKTVAVEILKNRYGPVSADAIRLEFLRPQGIIRDPGRAREDTF